jgi:hypothetical protein
MKRNATGSSRAILPSFVLIMFGWMLVWQAIQHDLTLVSRDRAMEAYQTEGLKILW